MPFPDGVPEVAWRGGIDLNPLDVTDADQMAWLSNLVWPEHDDRRELLARAIEIARADPPTIVRGDLVELLPEQVALAAEHGRVVVFHSAVIAYLDNEQRARFHGADDRARRATAPATGSATRVRGCCPRSTGPARRCPTTWRGLVLGVDGRAVGWTHGHGRA